MVKKNPQAETTALDKQQKISYDSIRKVVTNFAGEPKIKQITVEKFNKFVVEMKLHRKFTLKHMIPMWTDSSEFQITEHVKTDDNKKQKENKV